MNRLPKFRRSPLVSTLIFVFGLVSSILLITFLQLDIGAYKKELAGHLERALNKPVSLGDASLSFHDGIALDFRNLRIGEDASFSVHVPQLTALLNPIALLQGEIDIEQVLLEYPSLKLTLPVAQGDADLNLDRLGLKTLQVRKGSLVFTYPGTVAKPLRVENFNLVLHGLGRGLVSQLATTATLFQNNRNAELNAFIELSREHQNQPWRQGQLHGNLSLKNLRSKLIGHWEIDELPTMFDLALGFEGTPSRQVELNAELRDSLNLRSLISLSALWRSQAAEDSFRDLKLGLAGIPFRGELRFDRRQEEPVLRGHLELKETRLSTLISAYPSHPLKPLSGQILNLSADFSGPLRATEQNPLSPLQQAQLSLDNLYYTAGEFPLEEASLDIKLLNGRLSRVASHGSLGQIPFVLKGHSGPLSAENPVIDLELTALPDLELLHKKARAEFWTKQKLSGKIPVSLKLLGPSNNLQTRLSASLDKTELVIAKLLEKNPSQPLRLFAEAQLQPNRILLTSAGFSLNDARLETRGELRLKDDRWSGQLLLSSFETSRLQPYSPIFDFFQINGLAGGQINIGPQPQVRLDLKRGGARLTRLLGNLNRVEGQAIFDRNGIDLGTLRAHLGKSPIEISGAMKNWRNPLLSLHVTGKEIRAQDLVFTNPEMNLQNVGADLLISRGGITFSAINATLEQKTRVRLEGQMRGYRDAQTYLEATSEEADILQIIQLFSGPRPEPVDSTHSSNASLELHARVTKGHLGSFSFENARGIIHDRHNLFTLYPLDLNLDQGKVSGRVEFDRTRGNLLKISGAAENCDADRVYEMLFEKRGIFKGTLSGNFYLEGEEVGEQFWKTARGGGHLRINDGVMRELKGFAQIFSLLNVSQLFKFRLPDMNDEGLPITVLETSGRVDTGTLSYKNFRIVSPAINISALGKIDILKGEIDSTVGIKPLRTVDIILSRVPLFGWVLTGDEEALITALFTLKGDLENPEVTAAPASSVAKTALGIIGRALTLPFRVIQKTNELLTTPPRPKQKEFSAPAPENK